MRQLGSHIGTHLGSHLGDVQDDQTSVTHRPFQVPVAGVSVRPNGAVLSVRSNGARVAVRPNAAQLAVWGKPHV